MKGENLVSKRRIENQLSKFEDYEIDDIAEVLSRYNVALSLTVSDLEGGDETTKIFDPIQSFLEKMKKHESRLRSQPGLSTKQRDLVRLLFSQIRLDLRDLQQP